MRAGTFFLLCCVALAVASCRAKAKPTIIGKWQGDFGDTVEFRADGTFTLSGGEQSREGKYRMTDDKTIEWLTPDGKPGGQWAIVSLTQEDMVAMVPDTGKQGTFRRIK
jgi:hypothetical protein